MKTSEEKLAERLANEAKIAELRLIVAAAIEYNKPTHIVGTDEVGYGAIAGPLVLAGVYVPIDWKAPEGLTDSKELSDPEIERLYKLFAAESEGRLDMHWCLVWYPQEDIDREGLGKLRSNGLYRATSSLVDICKRKVEGSRPLAFVDGNLAIEDAVSVPKADLIVPAVSMASVMAKYTRDMWMFDAAKKFPGYGFENHVGYDVPEHRAALQRLGPCALHRHSNKTVERFTEKSSDLFDLAMSGELDE